MVGLDKTKDERQKPINPNQRLGLKVLMHRKDGTLALLVNGKEYLYWLDNAVLEKLLFQFWHQPINKANWLKEVHRLSRYYYKRLPQAAK